MSKIFTFYPDKDDQKSSHNCTGFKHVSLSNVSFHLKKKKNDSSISKVLLAGRGMGECPSVSLHRGKVIMGEAAGRNGVMTVVMEAEAVSGRVRTRRV